MEEGSQGSRRDLHVDGHSSSSPRTGIWNTSEWGQEFGRNPCCTTSLSLPGSSHHLGVRRLEVVVQGFSITKQTPLDDPGSLG